MPSIACPNCSAKLNAPDKLAGRSANCPRCGKPVPVPGATPSLVGHAHAAPEPSRSPPAGETPSPRAPRSRYVAANLLPGESVEFETSLHWFTFALPAALILGGVVACFVARRDFNLFMVGFAGVGVMAVGAVLLAVRAAAFWSSEFAVTTQRVVIKTGLLGRRTVELLLSKVDALSVDQGLLGRVLGYGTIHVAVATEKASFARVRWPLEFRRQVQLRAGRA